MQNEIFIFPWFVLPIVLIIGLVLVIRRPYWAYLLAVFMCISLSMQTMSFTRLEEIGAYFNLYEASLAIALLACLWEKIQCHQPFIFPKVAMVLLAVLFMGLLNSVHSYGLNYSVQKSFWLALTIPVQFILASNMVRGSKRIKSLLLVLIAGAVVSEVQHMAYVLHWQAVYARVDLLRTANFSTASFESWLLTGPYIVSGLFPWKYLQLAIGLLFTLGLLSTQSRSLLLALLGSGLVYYLWYIQAPKTYPGKRLRLYFLLLVLVPMMIAAVQFRDVAENYLTRLESFITERGQDDQSTTRRDGIRIELRDWQEGNIFIGRGLGYIEKVHNVDPTEGGLTRDPVAWGHIGYVSYLSNLGIIGFMVYGLLFPGSVILRAQRLLQDPDLPGPTRHFLLFTGAYFLYNALLFFLSGSFLGRAYLPGILAGVVWTMPLPRRAARWKPIPAALLRQQVALRPCYAPRGPLDKSEGA